MIYLLMFLEADWFQTWIELWTWRILDILIAIAVVAWFAKWILGWLIGDD